MRPSDTRLRRALGALLCASALLAPSFAHAKPAHGLSGTPHARPAKRTAAPPQAASAPAGAPQTAVPGANAPVSAPQATGAAGGTAPAVPDRVWASCTEYVPPGAARPRVVSRFPRRALSGYALWLEVDVDHGKGEVVFPQGFQVQLGTDAARALNEAGFVVPDPSGGAATRIDAATEVPDAGAHGTRTHVAIPFLALAKAPGRHPLTLPPVPIAVSRASGEVVTLCTEPHAIEIDDPTASVPDAKPRPNPTPRAQREEWTLAKHVTLALLAGALLGSLVYALARRIARRPRPAPPAPPPRPPWEVAFEELRAIRLARLVEQQRYAEHFDRVSDAVRKYVGARYGFDGLESTTLEIQAALRAVVPPVTEYLAISSFLEGCDLVKFARLDPSEKDCNVALEEAQRIVEKTVPAEAPPPATPARPPVEAA